MRALGRCAVLAAGLVLGTAWPPVHAQSSPEKAAETGVDEPATRSEGRAEGVSPIWAWANFAMLAAGLGYLVVKKGGPWFAARSVAIRKGIAEAEEIRADAEARAADVDRKLAGLGAEIEALRGHARQEQAAEAERIRQQTATDLTRIQEQAAREIDAAGKDRAPPTKTLRRPTRRRSGRAKDPPPDDPRYSIRPGGEFCPRCGPPGVRLASE